MECHTGQRGAPVAEMSPPHVPWRFVVVFSTLLILHVVLLGSVRLYPLIDLPNHLAVATIQRYAGAPANALSSYYSRDISLAPNTFHSGLCGLPSPISVEATNRLLYGLYAFLVPLSMLLLIRRLRGSPWASLLSFLLLYNYSFAYGFAGFTLAIPVALLFVLMTDLNRTRVSWGSACGVAALLALLYFMHVLVACMCLAWFAISVLFEKELPWCRRWADLALAIPAALLILVWWAHQEGESTVGFLLDYYRAEFMASIASRAGIVCYDHYHLFEGKWGLFIGVLASLCIVAPLAMGTLQDGSCAHRFIREPHVRRIFIFALMALGLFLFLPDSIPSQWKLFQRFSVFAWLGAILLGSVVWPTARSRLLGAVAIGACVVHLGLYAHCFHAFQRENAGFNAGFLPERGDGGRLAGLMFENSFRGRPVYIHFPNYYIIWKQGVATTSIISYRFGIIRRAATQDDLPAYHDILDDESVDRNRYRDMEWLLTRGDPEGGQDGYLVHHRRQRTQGAWSLYAKSSSE